MKNAMSVAWNLVAVTLILSLLDVFGVIDLPDWTFPIMIMFNTCILATSVLASTRRTH